METILLLANSEADGSLAKPALEALGAAKALCAGLPGSKLIVGLVGQSVEPAANRIAETPRDGDIDPNPNHNIDPNQGLNRP